MTLAELRKEFRSQGDAKITDIVGLRHRWIMFSADFSSVNRRLGV